MPRRMPQLIPLFGIVVVAILAQRAVGQSVGTDAPRIQLDDFYRRAREFENRRHWQQASEVYLRAARFYPNEDELRLRRLRAERRQSLSRRYRDISFTDGLLRLSESAAMDLHREVLDKLQRQYVEAIDFARVSRLGIEGLLLALSDPLFLATNASGGASPNISTLQATLAMRTQARVTTLADTSVELAAVLRLCRQSGWNEAAAVVLEFICAAVEGLDPYSTHLTRHHLEDLYAMIDGNFVGLGVEVRGGMDSLQIISVVPGSPAEEAGLAISEHIIAINGQSLMNTAADEAADRLRGEPLSSVHLSVRATGGTVREVRVVRREVHVCGVSGATLVEPNAGIGYLRIHTFQRHTLEELDQAVRTLLERGMHALIIDLRGNPGGLLDSAVQVADRFIDTGILVSTRGRSWGQSWVHRATSNDAWRFPLALLVDRESASASEIFAAAIQDHKRGIIVGSQSFGKGSVQSILPLRTMGTGLRLTTARYYSPSGRSLEGVGVHPDIVVSRPTDEAGDELPLLHRPDVLGDSQLREAIAHLSHQ